MKVMLATLNSKFIHTNLAIRYIREYSRYLEGREYEVILREYTINNSKDYILKDIYMKNIDILAFSVYIWNVDDVIKLCENIKKVNPRVRIILGGPEVSYDFEDVIKKYECVDFVLYGEGEVEYRDLMLYLLGKMKLEDVRGICYRSEGRIITNKPMPLIENLDEIPSPYEKIDKTEYENKIVYFESSRGCPFNCQYCLSSAINGLRYFSLDRIKRDLKNLIDAGVSQIKFIDRTFNADRKIAKEVMSFLSENDNGFTTYHFEVTAHLIDDDMLEFLKDFKPGLFQFEIGVQSTNEKTLEAVGRVDDFARLSKVVRTISGYKNIHQHLDLIAGLPYEDFTRFKKSFDDVFSLEPECLQLGFLKMIKGIGIRKVSDFHKYEYKDYPPYEILSNKYMSYDDIYRLKDIEEILEIYYNSGNFFLSLKFIINRYYKSPFDFFDELASFFNLYGYFDVSNGRNKLYEILLDFFKEVVLVKTDINRVRIEDVIDLSRNLEKNTGIDLDRSFGNIADGIIEELEIFREVLKYDFISLGKVSSFPSFFSRIEVDNYKDFGHKFLQNKDNQKKYTPKHFNKPAKNIIRYVHFEEFRYKILDLKSDIYQDVEKAENTIMFYYDIDKVFEKSKAYQVDLKF